MRRVAPRVVCSLVVMLTMATGSAVADPVIVAAGDIASPDRPRDAQIKTARLIGRIDPKVVLTLGDNQYPDGSFRQFMASYDPTWGRFKRRTRPSPGNHEYNTADAAGYFEYFDARAHRSSGGHYSFDIGRWHVVSINSGRGTISAAQLSWLGHDLWKDRHRCELAYWHHPRWSSGTVHGPNPRMASLWKVLYRHGVDVVLNGHEHSYERFKLMNPAGRWAPHTGIREFVVGTGGAGLYRMGPPDRGSQKRIDDRHGLLRMTLHPRSYSWRFIGIGGVVRDRGRRDCHR